MNILISQRPGGTGLVDLSSKRHGHNHGLNLPLARFFGEFCQFCIFKILRQRQLFSSVWKSLAHLFEDYSRRSGLDKECSEDARSPLSIGNSSIAELLTTARINCG